MLTVVFEYKGKVRLERINQGLLIKWLNNKVIDKVLLILE